VEEAVFVDFQDGKGREDFVRDHLEMSKICKMMCCPCCCLFVPWAGKTNKMEYRRECNGCSCPYAVTHNDKMAGRSHDVGCCDNGCLFCMCPWLTCSGHVKLMGMDNAQGEEKFTFLKELFACWPCVQAFAMGCAPLGVCCLAMNGCKHYCGGDEFLTITQPVYAGPWSRTDGKDPEEIGQMVMAYRFQPVTCCCAQPTPLKFYYKPTAPKGKELAPGDLTLLSLVLAIYRGLPVPCKLCSCNSFQSPTGVWCLDCGMNTTYTWKTVQQVMADCD